MSCNHARPAFAQHDILKYRQHSTIAYCTGHLLQLVEMKILLRNALQKLRSAIQSYHLRDRLDFFLDYGYLHGIRFLGRRCGILGKYAHISKHIFAKDLIVFTTQNILGHRNFGKRCSYVIHFHADVRQIPRGCRHH